MLLQESLRRERNYGSCRSSAKVNRVGSENRPQRDGGPTQALTRHGAVSYVPSSGVCPPSERSCSQPTQTNNGSSMRDISSNLCESQNDASLPLLEQKANEARIEDEITPTLAPVHVTL
eukprot:gb/GEZJ01006796.1/.p1 GENE.gb/GEZJ01006796.1/~~gb/GEZJ01006796.1/.p1  ORF type:complete len:119 (-),score=11.72 gb/GEZJ01006796.1/:433-789(-)